MFPVQGRSGRKEHVRLDAQAGLPVLLRFHQKEPGRGTRLIFYKGQPLWLQAVGPQYGQHLGQPFRPVAQREPPAVFEQAERAAADVFQGAVRLVAGRGAGGVAALEARREIGRVAGTQVVSCLLYTSDAADD